MTISPHIRKLRWRIVLGEGSGQAFGDCLDESWQERERALEFLYGREYGKGRNVRGGRQGSLDDSALTVPEWINQIHQLFPQQTIERLEKDAMERYQIQEMVTNPELLQRAVPSQALLKAVLQTKHLMNQEVLRLARDLVRRMVNELMEKIARPVQAPFQGSRNRHRHSSFKSARNFDAGATVRRNLKHFDPERRRLAIREPVFCSRIRRQSQRWQIIILVDQSGSMLDSAIHAAITAAIFWEIKSLRTHLVLFDTNLVDVTDSCQDPVETLMKVHLGGGTDIGQAVAYAARLVDNPRQAIVVLISDFFEGAPVRQLLSAVGGLVQNGTTVLGLAALDPEAVPNYDRELAQRLVNLGAHVAAMTPGELANWVAEKVR
jgi:Mg-chelatase subunit ChlD